MDTVNVLINVIIHCLILFVFLSLFFFLYIAKREQEALNDQSQQICKRIPYILDILKEQDKNNYINWQIVRQKSQEELNTDDLDINDYIVKNNTELKYVSIIIGVSLLILAILIYIYYKYIVGKYVDIGYIIKENIIIFIFIGIIEFLFFKNIASKYIPIFPFEISNTILTRIKENIMTNN